MIPAWSTRYPDPARLRHEVECAAESFVEALLQHIPRGEIRGIYLKGSAHKRWDTPIDYVPEISDVDMHVWFHEDDSWRRHLGTVSQAIEVQRSAELGYTSKVGRPLHEPRPQLIVMNKMMAELDDFVLSPQATVKVLYGDCYPEGDYSDADRIRRGECGRLIEDGSHVSRLPLQVVDRPGKYLWEMVRALVWRVSPTGPRVLHISGVETEEAWSLNRTGVVPALRDLGLGSLADSSAGFYVSGWEYFLSSYKDTDSGRAAIGHAVQVLTEGAEIARSWLARHPTSNSGGG